MLYNDGNDFLENGNSFPLKISCAVNSLIVKKIETEQGFQKVLELITCGKKETTNENYFKALEKTTGINKSDFNAFVWKLINAN